MAKMITHHGTRIFTLEAGEAILDHCAPDDIAVVTADEGWLVYFVGDDGEITGYEEPYASQSRAVGAAKAAAEFAGE